MWLFLMGLVLSLLGRESTKANNWKDYELLLRLSIMAGDALNRVNFANA